MPLRPPPASSIAEAPLLDDAFSTHDFGPVISRAGLQLRHTYHLLNRTNHPITITELINRKPCCGEIRAAAKALAPGDGTEVEVTLSVRQEFGDVVHETVVVTDPQQAQELVLRTVARAHPAARIEPQLEANGLALLTSEKPRPVTLRAFAYGTATHPPVDLARAEVRSSLDVKWAGPKEVTRSRDGLVEESRAFTVLLDPTGKSGEIKDQILLEGAGRPVCDYSLNWEAVLPLTPAPSLVIIRPGIGRSRVRLQSRDRRMFRVTAIECSVAGVTPLPVVAAPSLEQLVVLQVDGVLPASEGPRNVVIVTDHPGRPRVELPLVVIQ
jgi:hypothetical protein